MIADLAFETQERKVLATVADGIVTAAAGRALRVAIACPPAHLTFAGQLTRALHARGRACHCIAPASTSSPSDDLAAPRSTSVDPTIAVIVGGSASADDEVYRVSVCLTEDHPKFPAATSGDPTEESHDETVPATDIVLDYGDPNGPAIRQFMTHEQVFA
ncbi:hypothetical protein GA0074692_5362 [Micromonospora pallida]|uniref:Uncharacterized protein n=1 Tax=Micromonospora pallida TaxID=145854 RepID=A0A1C6TDA5_9ACTN|nr:hypothetical protein [Micromonospora pallida]SCL39435.1 hypothetical protein GA0074692_5362 [Micromonospora pallida]